MHPSWEGAGAETNGHAQVLTPLPLVEVRFPTPGTPPVAATGGNERVRKASSNPFCAQERTPTPSVGLAFFPSFTYRDGEVTSCQEDRTSRARLPDASTLPVAPR